MDPLRGAKAEMPSADLTARPRFAVFGIFGRTNLGNEATLAAFLDNVWRRYPDAQITCIGPDISDVSQTHGLPLIAMDPIPLARHFWRVAWLPFARPLAHVAQLSAEPLRARRARAQVRAFDALIVPGTGVLDDFGQGPLDLPYHLLRWCRAARHASIPINFLSVGVEPVPGRMTRRVLRKAAELATYRSYRDTESKANAQMLGVPADSDEVYPDLAFGLSKERLPSPRSVTSPPREVGIGVMGYYGWNEPSEVGEAIYQGYLRKLKNFVSWLLERDYTVRLLIGDTAADARPVLDLVEAFAGRRETECGLRLIAEPIKSFGDLLHQIVQTDLVVGTRFHNVLLSLLLERPVISLGYSGKNDALMKVVGLNRHAHDVSDFDERRLIASFEQLARDGGGWIRSMRANNLSFCARLEEQFDRVMGLIG